MIKEEKIEKTRQKITKNMSFSEIINKNPEVVETLLNNGMHCIGCPMSQQETLEQGAIAHRLNIDELIKELNEKVEK